MTRGSPGRKDRAVEFLLEDLFFRTHLLSNHRKEQTADETDLRLAILLLDGAAMKTAFAAASFLEHPKACVASASRRRARLRKCLAVEFFIISYHVSRVFMSFQSFLVFCLILICLFVFDVLFDVPNSHGYSYFQPHFLLPDLAPLYYGSHGLFCDTYLPFLISNFVV